MINRYWGAKMKELWGTSRMKFAYWLRVEIAVLYAREDCGQIPRGAGHAIRSATWIDDEVVRAIERRDREIGHDLNAFVEIMRLQILADKTEFLRIIFLGSDEEFNNEVSRALEGVANNPNAGYFHDGMTSYDTEEPAMTLLIQDSCDQIQSELAELLVVLSQKARQYKGVVMIGRTHGQHAQPITFGIKIVNWYSSLLRAANMFADAKDNARVMKLSGAVGVFGTLGPKVEEFAADGLRLKPVLATQIVLLDYRARIINELAIISSLIEKIANDLWEMCQTEIGEVREPFSKRQKGSSAMPHKKNPINLEQIRGLAGLVRGYAHTMMELICTSQERDISHSAQERMLVPDAFGIVDHQIRKLTAIIRDMEVFPERMKSNIELSYGTFASQKVEMFLKQLGVPAEIAYRKVQKACNLAVVEKRSLYDVLLSGEDLHPFLSLAEVQNELQGFFDPQSWVKEEGFIYAREKIGF